MSYHHYHRKKKRFQRGDKIVLKYGVPAAIFAALLIQITVKGVPNFLNNFIDKIEKEAEDSRKILYSAIKTGALKKTRNVEDQYMFGKDNSENLVKKGFNALSEEDAKDVLLKSYQKGTNEIWDRTYDYLEQKKKENEIEDYQKLFKEELK